jgi:RNA polymerase sigma-70 factor (ECF subfamily)
MMFRLRNEPDDRLIRDTLAGEPQAFSRLVERYLQTAHAVAFAHTGNHADAEDAAQDAFVKAYQSLDTLRDRNRFGAWLAALTRNAAIDLVRKRQRRDKLAEQLPRKEPLMISEPERSDEWELVRAHLMAMEEGPREVILLHYFAGHSLREVAQILDISRAAAQKRLVRAREVLSERLVKALGETPAEERPREERVKKVMGAVASAPVTWKVTAATGSAGLAGVASSVVAMVTPKTLALIGVIVAVSGFGLWKALQHNNEAPSPQTVAATNDTAPETPAASRIYTDLLAGAASSASKPEANPPAAATSPQIQGHVIDETGKLMSGVKVLPRMVTVKEDGTEELAKTAKGSEQIETDSEGAFTLNGLAPGTYDVQLLLPGTTVYTSKSFKRFTVAEGEPINDMQIVYDRTQGVRIFGRVVDLEGKPVADAEVSSKGGPLIEARTNPEGEFSFTRFEGGPFNMYASHPKYGSAFLANCAPNSEGFELVLGGQGAIEGQVVAAETGTPLPDFSITWLDGWQQAFSWGMDYALRHVHDEAGRFSLRNVQAGNVTLVVRAPGRATTFRTGETIEPGGTTSGVVIALERGVSVKGRVVDAAGEPVADAMIFEGSFPWVYVQDYPALARTYTDDDGHFVLNDISRSCAWVSAYQKDHQPGGVAAIDLTKDPPAPVTITLGSGGAIEGRVLLNDQPVAGAHVELLVEKGARTGGTAAQTDAEGRYSMARVSACEGQIRASFPLGPGIMNERMRFLPIAVEAGQTTVADFVFPVQECTVEGLIAYNGVVPPNMGIGIDCVDESGVREHIMVPVQPNGTYSIGDGPAGTVRFDIYWEHKPGIRGTRPTTLECTIAPGQTLRQDFVFEGTEEDIEQGFFGAVAAKWPDDMIGW